MTNNFKIILNEQTPLAPEILDVNNFINENIDKLNAFREFAENDMSCFTAVGLAANQVSIDNERFNIRVFAIKNISTDNSYTLIINPIIEEYIGIKELKCEGCLTWPNKTIVAERSREIKVTYYDINGIKHENEIYKGFSGQIWQHEINHLRGINEQIEDQNYKVKPLDIGRNDKCPCNSGKKYKQCCIDL